MKISKLTRYDGRYSDESVGGPLALCENGDYVLYAVARAREDALLNTLRDVVYLHCSMDVGDTSTRARRIIREIKATR